MTNLENLKKLAEGLGADASGAETNAEAIEVIAEAAAKVTDLEARMNSAESGIPPYAFYGRTDLTKFLFAAEAPRSVGTAAFADCKNLTEVMLTSATDIGKFAFFGCSALVTANLYSVKRTERSSFTQCTKLTTVNAYSIEEIGDESFAHCAALASVTLSNAKTIGRAAFTSTAIDPKQFPKTTEIGSNCFANVKTMTSADFPVIERIGWRAFSGCSALETVVIRNSERVVVVFKENNIHIDGGSQIFESTLIASGTGYIYVPKALIQQYKTAEHWNVYANQYRSLEDYTVDGTTTGALDESKI